MNVNTNLGTLKRKHCKINSGFSKTVHILKLLSFSEVTVPSWAVECAEWEGRKHLSTCV